MKRFSLQSQASKGSKGSYTTCTTKLQNQLSEHKLKSILSLKHTKSTQSSITNRSQKIQISSQLFVSKLIRQSDQYRNLLIQQSYIDLQLIQQQKAKKALENKIVNNKKQVTILKDQIDKFKTSINKKSQHILKYHDYLAHRMKQVKPWKIAISKDLSVKRQNKYKDLKRQNIIKINQNKSIPLQLKQSIKRQKQSLDLLRNQFQINQQKTMRKLLQQERYKINRFRKQSIERIRFQYKKLQKQLECLEKNKQQYKNLNQNLQYLLTVQQQHQNSCIIVQRAMILKQNQKVITYTFEKETSNQIENNLIPNLLIMLEETNNTKKQILSSIKQAQNAIDDYQAILDSKMTIFNKFSQ